MPVFLARPRHASGVALVGGGFHTARGQRRFPGLADLAAAARWRRRHFWPRGTCGLESIACVAERTRQVLEVVERSDSARSRVDPLDDVGVSPRWFRR